MRWIGRIAEPLFYASRRMRGRCACWDTAELTEAFCLPALDPSVAFHDRTRIVLKKKLYLFDERHVERLCPSP
jgi:hypothetical protein